MAKDKYVCHRKCYYNNTVFCVGDPLPPGLPPNKHFSIDGEGPDADEKHIVMAGDDPRSTKQIIIDLKEKHGIEMGSKTGRKPAFAKWLKAENAAADKRKEAATPAKTKEKAPAADADKADDADVLGGKKFGECLPDELDKITNEQLGKLINKRFKVDFKFSGKSKKVLIETALKYESKQKGAKAK